MARGVWKKLAVGLVFGALLMPALAQTLVLNTGIREPFTTAARDGFVDRVVAEIFRRIGRDARVEVYEASERALISANEGIDDGTALRIKGLEAQYPNLVRVPEKLMDNDFVAYTLGKRFPTPNWAALRGHDVAFVIGWKIFEANVEPSPTVTRVKDAEQLFNLLRLGRTELVLYERWQGQYRLRQIGLDGKAAALEPPLAQSEMFFYLHRRHAALIEPAAKALADMKRDGTYRRIFESSLGPMAGR